MAKLTLLREQLLATPELSREPTPTILAMHNFDHVSAARVEDSALLAGVPETAPTPVKLKIAAKISVSAIIIFL